MIKIWRNRIEAGTQKLSDCPVKYRTEVIGLIRADLETDESLEFRLKQLVKSSMMTREEYQEIAGKSFES